MNDMEQAYAHLTDEELCDKVAGDALTGEELEALRDEMSERTMTVNYADHCEVEVQGEAVFVMRQCRGRGLRVVVHPDRVTRKVMCSTHSIKAYPSGYLVDWDETQRVFGNGRPKGVFGAGGMSTA